MDLYQKLCEVMWILYILEDEKERKALAVTIRDGLKGAAGAFSSTHDTVTLSSPLLLKKAFPWVPIKLEPKELIIKKQPLKQGVKFCS